MKFLVLLLLFTGLNPGSEPKVTELRALYFRSATDKAAADKLLALVSATKEKALPVLICYKGVAELMQAKYGMNPVAKLRRFKTGKMWIEKALKEDPDHGEMRFLRFSIQTNLPAFLGYNEQIDVDKKFLLSKVNDFKDLDLKQRTLKYLSASKYCSTEEQARMKTLMNKI